MEEGERKEDGGEKRPVKESRVRYIRKITDGSSKKNSKEEDEKKGDRDPKGNKERCSEGDRSCRLGQGIMVLLHF